MPLTPPPSSTRFWNGYGGAFEALAQQGILDQMDEVAGTSAGAITAALLALRYSPPEIQRLMLSLDFSKFEDGGWTGFFRIFSRYGWYRGDYFLNLLRCFVGQQTGKEHATAWQASGNHPSAAVASHERVRVFGFHKCGSAFDEPPPGARTPECQPAPR